MTTSVSVVIPTLNSASTLERCLASIAANRSRHPYEIVIVDGGSWDGTVNIAKKYAHKVLVETTFWRGVNRNKGVRQANGEIICFTDSDCVVPENWIDFLVDGLLRLHSQDPKVVGVGGGNIPLLEHPSFWERAIARAIRSPLVSFRARNVSLYKEERPVLHNPPMNSAYFKESITQVGGFGEEENVGEDIELDAKILDRGYKLYYLPGVVVSYRHRSSFRKFWHQMYEFGQNRIRVGRKHPRYLAWYHYGPIVLLLLTFSPFSFIPLMTALANGAYGVVKERSLPQGLAVALLTWSFYLSYGAGEINGLLWTRR